MKKLNLAVVFMLAVSLILTFSFAGIASKAPEVNNLKQIKQAVANPIELVSLKENKAPGDKVILPVTTGIKEIEAKGYVTVNNLNVRSMGSMDGKIISSLNKGTEIYVYDEEDGWYYAEYAKDKKGWVYSKYVEFKKDPPAKMPEINKIEKQGYVTVNNLNVRDLGSMKGKVIASLSRLTKIYIFGEKDGWYYAEYAKDKRGWLYSKYVELKEYPLPNDPELTKIEKNGYVTPISLNVRDLGSMKGKIIGSLKQGARVYVFGVKDGWYYVEYAKDKKGWVSDMFIVFKDIDPVVDLGLNKIEKIGTVTVNGLNIRTLGSINGKVLIKVDKGTPLYVYGEKNGWYYVEFVEHAFGWVSSKYVEFKKDPPAQEPEIYKIEKSGYVTVNGLNVRDLGSMKGKVIASLKKDTKIYVYGEKNGWYYVEYAKNKKGWVYGSYVMFKASDPVIDLGLKRIEKIGKATVNGLNVRDLGSMKGKVLISINKGDALYVFGEKNDWYYVQFFEDAYGWVYGKYMTFK